MPELDAAMKEPIPGPPVFNPDSVQTYVAAQKEMVDKIHARAAKHRAIYTRMNPYSDWINIAGRDGSMTIFHIRDTLEGIKENLRHSATFAPRIPHKELKVASDDFYDAFPDWRLIRHATGHRGELNRDPKRTKENATSQPFRIGNFVVSEGKEVMVAPQMMGRKYVATNKGKLVEYELSEPNLQKLRAIQRKVYSPFQRAADSLNAEYEAGIVARIEASRKGPPPVS